MTIKIIQKLGRSLQKIMKLSGRYKPFEEAKKKDIEKENHLKVKRVRVFKDLEDF